MIDGYETMSGMERVDCKVVAHKQKEASAEPCWRHVQSKQKEGVSSAV